ncbi:hypothetical protein NQ317_019468 [Molorchus minor]|uniref:Uncharacterized protein n=1 Tax=Molorchus minor TaxID=1323400 RepID=A0ABQ9JPR1_9CUCU|nr:hypothetical protein NQ317_019468 [Molorchus minor]
MYLYTVENYDIEEITHKYLIIRHTENAGDSMHSCIEKESAEKNGPIYVPSELVTIAKSTKKKGNPYEVKGNVNRRFHWLEKNTKWVEKGEPNKIFYKTSYQQEEFNIINIRKKTRTQRGSLTLLPAVTNDIVATSFDGHLEAVEPQIISEVFGISFSELSEVEVFTYLNATPASRNIGEGESILNAGHLILCGVTEFTQLHP